MRNATLRRRAAVLTTLVAALAVPMLGVLAFAIDLGYVYKVQQECQNVADSASLAGVSQLYAYSSFSGATDTSLRTTLQSKAVSAAQAEAQKYVQLNTAGGLALSIPTADIQVGYWNANSKTFTQTNTASPPDPNWPNAVKVTVRCDDTNLPKSNGSLKLFFGPVLGVSSVPIQTTATATLNATAPSVGGLGGTNNDSTYNSNSQGGLLPFAVDVDSYMYYLQHGTVGPGAAVIDNYSVPKGLGSTNAVAKADGIPEFKVYPPPDLIHPSQKGLLSFDPSNFGGNGNTISTWIDPGPSAQELISNFGANGFQTPVQLYGTPGNKVGHFSDLTGEIRTLPLIDYSRTTTGNHGQYYVVATVAVQVVYGPDNTAIWVQPATGSIPSAMSGTPPSSDYTYTYGGANTPVPAFFSNIAPPSYRRFKLVK